jgi:hypothetical protein
MKLLTSREKEIIFNESIKTYFKHVEAVSFKEKKQVLSESLIGLFTTKIKQNNN